MRTQAQPGKRQRADLPVVRQLLVDLKALECIDRVILPLTIGFTVEVSAIGKRTLNFRVTLRVGMNLVTGAGRLPNNATAGLSAFRI